MCLASLCTVLNISVSGHDYYIIYIQAVVRLVHLCYCVIHSSISISLYEYLTSNSWQLKHRSLNRSILLPELKYQHRLSKLNRSLSCVITTHRNLATYILSEYPFVLACECLFRLFLHLLHYHWWSEYHDVINPCIKHDKCVTFPRKIQAWIGL